jgi:hypothetical protein
LQAGISGAGIGIGIVVIISIVIIDRNKRRQKTGAKNFQFIDEEFIKNYGSIAPKRYTY